MSAKSISREAAEVEKFLAGSGNLTKLLENMLDSKRGLITIEPSEDVHAYIGTIVGYARVEGLFRGYVHWSSEGIARVVVVEEPGSLVKLPRALKENPTEWFKDGFEEVMSLSRSHSAWTYLPQRYNLRGTAERLVLQEKKLLERSARE